MQRDHRAIEPERGRSKKLIIAVHVHQNAKDFDCAKCSHRHCDKDNAAPFAMWSIPGVIESNVCLLPLITERTAQLIKLYQHYQAQHLFTGGGIMSQPNVYIEAMGIIESTVNGS